MLINTIISHLVNILQSEGYDVSSNDKFITKRIKEGINRGFVSCCVNFYILNYWQSSKPYEKAKTFQMGDPDLIETLLQVIRQYE